MSLLGTRSRLFKCNKFAGCGSKQDGEGSGIARIFDAVQHDGDKRRIRHQPMATTASRLTSLSHTTKLQQNPTALRRPNTCEPGIRPCVCFTRRFSRRYYSPSAANQAMNRFLPIRRPCREVLHPPSHRFRSTLIALSATLSLSRDRFTEIVYSAHLVSSLASLTKGDVHL